MCLIWFLSTVLKNTRHLPLFCCIIYIVTYISDIYKQHKQGLFLTLTLSMDNGYPDYSASPAGASNSTDLRFSIIRKSAPFLRVFYVTSIAGIGVFINETASGLQGSFLVSFFVVW